jgi:hypothetical protein
MKGLSTMQSLGKIEHWEVEYVDTNKQVACLLFQSSHRHQMALVAFLAKVAPVMVEVYPCLCASSVSVDFLLYHLGKEGSHPFDIRKPLPGVFRSQTAPWYAWVPHHPTSSLLRLRCEVC